MNITKSRKSWLILSGTTLLLSGISFLSSFIQPTLFVAPMLLAWAILAGLSMRNLSIATVITVVATFMTSTLLWTLVWRFVPKFESPIPFMAVGSYLGAGVLIGLSIGNKSEIPKWRTWILFLVGMMALLGSSGFSSIDRFVDGMLALLLLYFSSGVALRFRQVSWGRAQIFLAPFIIFVLPILLTSEGDSTIWIKLWLQPILCMLVFNMGYWVVSETRPLRYLYLATAVVPSMLYFSLLPRLLLESSWENNLEQLPAFSLQDTSGTIITNEDIENKVVWMSFYNNRCKPCIDEMEHVAKVASEFHANPSVDFLSICSSASDTYDKYRGTKIFHAFGLKTLYEANPTLSNLFAPQGVPVGILVNRSGNVVVRKEGFMDSEAALFEEKLKESIKSLL